MSKPAKIILCICAALLVLLAAAFLLEYFVFQVPLFDRGGWYTADTGAVQYRDYYGKPLTGWQSVEEEMYYFSPEGSMATGWQSIDGQRYYFNDNGTMRTGWLELDGKRYYLTENGNPYSGWLEEEGERWYFADGEMHTGWLEQPEGTYLLDGEGHSLTGWTEYEGLRYYLDEEGILNSNWQDTADGLTYLVDGVMHTGWLDVPEGKFYFNDNGIAHTGWVTDETGRYYLYGDGTYATGFVEINGIKRYFTATGEYVLLCNRWNPVPDDYEMNLVAIGNFKLDASCHDAMLEMMDAAKADGVTLTLNSTYRSKATQQSMWETRRVKYMGQGMTSEEADAYIGRSVAVPGTSEHQTGLAADIKGSQKVYDWLAENSWKYGFILRYPDDKIDITGIIYEPWHFRYVGQAFAKEIYDSGLCLEEYLEKLEQQ